MEIKGSIKRFLEKYLKKVEISDDDDIFALGYVNSLFAMQLVMFVEKEFSIKIENSDLDLENFRSINAITEMVNKKIANGV
ncbi:MULTISPECIES: acyl carrier protein [Bacillus cereus group]|uniref:Acyl carrier protein n=1 Tax=Bacillus cereus TaxID=1396 RepID=A0AAN5XNC6_BACCE|nr:MULTISPECIES: phosphopantetheine-binding protein [Bacillus cereus group]KAB2447916.1 acyl carrier protein [Bacillus cereus]KAB2484501.1 acyl carrier protein [Bacillus cereus]MCU4957132.1 phosphopantetheine-binding protein [Bacillus cereus]PHG45626.1 D-alanyl carrier protein [Bacillus wiedmannii]